MWKRFKQFSLLKKIGCLIIAFPVGLAGMLCIAVIVGLLFAPDYTQQSTPAGYPVNLTTYLTMPDDTRIFLDVWLPETLQANDTIPAIMETSRYVERFQVGPLYKFVQFYAKTPDPNYEAASTFTQRGYAYIWVQAPGTGASTGTRAGEFLPEEIDAMGAAIAWIAAQPWSNQRIGAVGISYSGTTADMSAVTLKPQLKAVAPLHSDFDSYLHSVRPGGIFMEGFTRLWSDSVAAMDRDDICTLMEIESGEKINWPVCFLTRLLIQGTKRLAGSDMALYTRALSEHQGNQLVYPAVQAMAYKDIPYGASGMSINDIAVYRYKGELERAGVNAYYRVSWFDAGTVEGALQRYLTINTPHILEIGPWGHGAETLVDPFNATIPNPKEQQKVDEVFAFFDKHLKADSPQEQRLIRYYTYGENTWKTTTVWPPAGVTPESWYFREEQHLKLNAPEDEDGQDRYIVDFTTTTGKNNRWMAQMGWDIAYPDRREEDRKLLTYTSASVDEAVEVTGSPTITLYIASTHADGALHVYLEDVAPDGCVSYLTEGVLRVLHRKISDPADAPFVPLGVYHSFLQQDAMPLIPGEIAEIAITLLPISTVFKKGHRIRVAIAGYDETFGTRYPPEGTPELVIGRNSKYPSRIQLPVIRNTHQS